MIMLYLLTILLREVNTSLAILAYSLFTLVIMATAKTQETTIRHLAEKEYKGYARAIRLSNLAIKAYNNMHSLSNDTLYGTKRNIKLRYT